MILKSKTLKLILILMSILAPVIDIISVHPQQLTLALTQALKSFPSDGMIHPVLYLTLQDSSGKPYPLPYPINVTLTCSDDRSLKIPNKATINPANYYVIINASSNVLERKIVEVTASAPGYQSSKLNIVIEPPSGTPKSLEVTIMPNILMPLAQGEAEVIVTLVDAYGKPTRARADINIVLSSSNINVATLASNKLVIEKGKFSAKTKLTSTGLAGSTTITASTPDLGTGSGTLSVIGSKPEKLYIWTNERHLVNEPGYVFVAITDSNSRPVKVTSPVTVSLYSSNTEAFTVQRNLTIGVGEWSGFAELLCVGSGQATIYASSGNLTTAQKQIEGRFESEEPYEIRIYSLASSLPADERSCIALLVQVVDSSGYPAKSRGIRTIDLFSSNSAILEVAGYVDIPSGKSKVNVTAIPKIPGSVRVTAVSSGMVASEINVNVYSPTPSQVNVIAPPIPSDGEVEACLMMLDSGTPAPLQNEPLVTLSSSNTEIGDGNGSVTIPKKSYFKYFKIKGKSPGQFTLTASGSGLPTGRSQISVLETKPSSFYLSYVKPIINYEFPLVIQLISSQGSSAVSYEPIAISLASSNTSCVQMPETVLILAEETEALVFGKGLLTDSVKLTLTSQGFKSLLTQITPAPISLVIQIVTEGRFPAGETITVKSRVLLEGKPVEGIDVNWKGEGLKYFKSRTDSNGIAENTLTLKEKENNIEASINTGGTGYLVAKKTIIGYKDMYTLTVSSNAQVNLEGSGNYFYGDKIVLIAPMQANMPHILGLLGGRYYFKEWTGAVESSSNVVVYTITGDEKQISIRAVYAEEYLPVILSTVVIAVVAVSTVLARKYLPKILKFRSKPKPKPLLKG